MNMKSKKLDFPMKAFYCTLCDNKFSSLGSHFIMELNISAINVTTKLHTRDLLNCIMFQFINYQI